MTVPGGAIVLEHRSLACASSGVAPRWHQSNCVQEIAASKPPLAQPSRRRSRRRPDRSKREMPAGRTRKAYVPPIPIERRVRFICRTT